MSVRKRTWTTGRGEIREAWNVDYADQQGERHIRTFDKKKEADAFHANVTVDVTAGTHTASSRSKTLEEARRSMDRGLRAQSGARNGQLVSATSEPSYSLRISEN